MGKGGRTVSDQRPRPVLLDDDGNEITPGGKVLLDDDGNPITQPSADHPHARFGRAAMKTLGNVPGSTARLVGGLYQAVTNPIETAKNLGRVGLGVVEKAIPGTQRHEPYADAVGRHYADRYGGASNVIRSITEDPVGVVADASVLAGGAVPALRAAGAPAGVVRGLQRIETVSNPVRVARGLARRTQNAGQKLESVAVSLKERGLKPKESDLKRMSRFGQTVPERSQTIARRLLEERIPTSRAGADKLHGRVDDLHNQVDDLLANSGAQASTKPLVSELDATRATFEKQLVPADDLAAVDGTLENLLQNDALARTRFVPEQVPTGIVDASGQPIMRTQMRPAGRELLDRVPVGELNTLKRGTYKRLGPKQYGGELKSASVEAEKALARGARQSIEDVVPEVGPLNAKQAELLDLLDVLDDSVARTAKNNPIGWSDAFIASHSPLFGAASWLSRHPGAASPFVQAGFDVGRFGQRVGSKAQQKLGPAAAGMAQALRAAVLAELAREEGR